MSSRPWCGHFAPGLTQRYDCFSKEYILKRKRVVHTEEILNLFLKERQGVLHFSHDDQKKGIEEKTCVLFGNLKYRFVRQTIFSFYISIFISIIPYFPLFFFTCTFFFFLLTIKIWKLCNLVHPGGVLVENFFF